MASPPPNVPMAQYGQWAKNFASSTPMAGTFGFRQPSSQGNYGAFSPGAAQPKQPVNMGTAYNPSAVGVWPAIPNAPTMPTPQQMQQRYGVSMPPPQASQPQSATRASDQELLQMLWSPGSFNSGSAFMSLSNEDKQRAAQANLRYRAQLRGQERQPAATRGPGGDINEYRKRLYMLMNERERLPVGQKYGSQRADAIGAQIDALQDEMQQLFGQRAF